MNWNILNRKIHHWGSIVIALPVLLILGTGLMLQLKKQLPWVQPPEIRGAGGAPALTLPQVLEIARGVPQAAIRDWGDVSRVDVRPSRGMLKVPAANGWEVQIDTATGAVLQVAYRRSDAIEALHDGSWFGDGAKYGVFLPAGIGLFVLWSTGMYLFVLPYTVRTKRRRGGAAPSR